MSVGYKVVGGWVGKRVGESKQPENLFSQAVCLVQWILTNPNPGVADYSVVGAQ